MVTWRLISYHGGQKDQVLNWYVKNKLIAIGWGLIGDLKELNPNSASEIGKQISSFYPELKNRATGGPSLWHFYKSIKKGDLVVLVGEEKKIVVKVEDDNYYFNQEGIEHDADYKHHRSISLVTLNREQIQLLSNSVPTQGHNPRWPLFQFSNPVYPKSLME